MSGRLAGGLRQSADNAAVGSAACGVSPLQQVPASGCHSAGAVRVGDRRGPTKAARHEAGLSGKLQEGHVVEVRLPDPSQRGLGDLDNDHFGEKLHGRGEQVPARGG